MAQVPRRARDAELLPVSGLLVFDGDDELFLGNRGTCFTEAVVHTVVVDNRSVKSEEVKSSRAVGVLEVWWEKEREDHSKGDLCADILEFWRSLRDGEQEDVTFLVCSFSII